MSKFDTFIFKASIILFIGGYISLIIRHWNEIKIVAFFQNPLEAILLIIPLTVIVIIIIKYNKKGD